MPNTAGGVIINPQGQTLVVDITNAAGNRVATYTAANGSTVWGLPATIVARSEFHVVSDGQYNISIKRNGLEIANSSGGTVSLGIEDGSIIALSPTTEEPSEGGVYAQASAWNQSLATDGKRVTDAAIATPSGASAVVTSASNPFTAADVGKYFWCSSGGTDSLRSATGASISGTIASFQSPGQVTVTLAAALGTVSATSGMEMLWGSDQASAINAVLSAGGQVVLDQKPYFITSSLTLANRAQLRGMGKMSQLVLAPAVAANTHMVTLVNGNVCQTYVGHLKLVGNRLSQSNTGLRGIYYNNTANSSGTLNNQPYDNQPDSHHIVEHVLVSATNGTGVYLDGKTRAALLFSVNVSKAAGYGIRISGTDDQAIGCVTEWCDSSGFYLSGDNQQLEECKAFRNGVTAQADSHGFQNANLANHQTLIGCTAEQNWFDGFNFDASYEHTVRGCKSQSNGKGGSGSGLNLVGTTDSDFDISLSGWDIPNPVGVTFSAGATACCVRLRAKSGSYTTLISGTTTGNEISVNAYRGQQTPAFAASYTPDLTLGQIISITLTGNITINAPSAYWRGAEMTLILTEDATGGRTITMNAIYKTTWTPVTTASKVNAINLVFDGTNFVQRGVATGA